MENSGLRLNKAQNRERRFGGGHGGSKYTSCPLDSPAHTCGMTAIRVSHPAAYFLWFQIE